MIKASVAVSSIALAGPALAALLLASSAHGQQPAAQQPEDRLAIVTPSFSIRARSPCAEPTSHGNARYSWISSGYG
jgi:hypothetical protein